MFFNQRNTKMSINHFTVSYLTIHLLTLSHCEGSLPFEGQETVILLEIAVGEKAL